MEAFFAFLLVVISLAAIFWPAASREAAEKAVSLFEEGDDNVGVDFDVVFRVQFGLKTAEVFVSENPRPEDLPDRGRVYRLVSLFGRWIPIHSRWETY